MIIHGHSRYTGRFYFLIVFFMLFLFFVLFRLEDLYFICSPFFSCALMDLKSVVWEAWSREDLDTSEWEIMEPHFSSLRPLRVFNGARGFHNWSIRYFKDLDGEGDAKGGTRYPESSFLHSGLCRGTNLKKRDAFS